jgi:hypothetical protein
MEAVKASSPAEPAGAGATGGPMAGSPAARRSSAMTPKRLLVAFGAAVAVLASAANAQDRPRAVADQRLEVATADGTGLLALFLSADWSKPRPEVTRAVLVFHGDGRNARGYWNTARRAREAAGEQGVGALLVVSHFLAEVDLEDEPPADAGKLLRWTSQGWKDGRPALGPAPLSSFDAIDAMLARLANRALFPNLAQVVIAGHSAGGQIVQRNGVVGTGAAKLTALGIRVRTVVANPSSYAYFSADRPFEVGRCGRPRTATRRSSRSVNRPMTLPPRRPRRLPRPASKQAMRDSLSA